MAPQLTRMKALAARFDLRCRARAISSLPVPVSPRMRTVASDGATFATCFSTCRMDSQEPTNLLKHRGAVNFLAQSNVLVLETLFNDLAILDVGPRGIPSFDAPLLVPHGIKAEM